MNLKHFTTKQLAIALWEKAKWSRLRVEPTRSNDELIKSIKVYENEGTSGIPYLMIELPKEAKTNMSVQIDNSDKITNNNFSKNTFFWIKGSDCGSYRNALSCILDEIIIETYSDSEDFWETHMYENAFLLLEAINEETIPYNTFVTFFNADNTKMKKLFDDVNTSKQGIPMPDFAKRLEDYINKYYG